MGFRNKIEDTLEQKILQLKSVEEYLNNRIPVKVESERTTEYKKNKIEITAQISILRFLLSEA